jgi:hypothetical protein
MSNSRTVLLVGDDPAHAKAFRDALLDADGLFEGKRAESTLLILNSLKSIGVRLTTDGFGTQHNFIHPASSLGSVILNLVAVGVFALRKADARQWLGQTRPVLIFESVLGMFIGIAARVGP